MVCLVACEESQRHFCWTESITRDRSCERSKTFPGIALAMASQFTQDFPEQLYFDFGGVS